jgi:hypothetical protein
MSEVKKEPEKINRRSYLKYVGAGVVVVAVAGAGAYYATMPAAPPTTPTTQTTTPITETVTESMATTTGIPPEAVTSTLTFDDWAYRPEAVAQYVDTFNKVYGEKVNVETITGDYRVSITGKLASGSPVDLLYAFPFYISGWYNAGYLADIDSLPTLQNYLNDVYPNLKDAYKDQRTGHYLGLGYFTSWICTQTNQAILEKAGLKDAYPKDLFEFIDQLRTLKKGGYAESPWQPWWAQADYAIPWQFEHDHATQGAQLFDNNYDPVFDTNTATADILKIWKDAYDERLVPRDSLTTTLSDWQAGFAAGTYAYMMEQCYDIAYYNDPANSKLAGKFSFIPDQSGGNKWGFVLSPGYVITKRDRTPMELQRLYRLLSFFGYRDNTNTLRVARTWALPPSQLFSVFPEVMNDMDVKQNWITKGCPYRGEEDYNRLLEGYFSATVPSWWLSCPFSNDFNVKLQERIPGAITGQTSIPDTITALRKDAQDLKKALAT